MACKLKMVHIILYSLLVAIGIEAFNRFSQLKNEEKNKSKSRESVVMTPKTSKQEDEVSIVRQEDEVSAVSEITSALNVREHHENIITCLYFTL